MSLIRTVKDDEEFDILVQTNEITRCKLADLHPGINVCNQYITGTIIDRISRVNLEKISFSSYLFEEESTGQNCVLLFANQYARENACGNFEVGKRIAVSNFNVDHQFDSDSADIDKQCVIAVDSSRAVSHVWVINGRSCRRRVESSVSDPTAQPSASSLADQTDSCPIEIESPPPAKQRKMETNSGATRVPPLVMSNIVQTSTLITTSSGSKHTTCNTDRNVDAVASSAADEQSNISADRQSTTAAGKQSTAAAGQQSTGASKHSAAADKQSTIADKQSTSAGQQSSAVDKQSTSADQQSTSAGQQSSAVDKQSTFADQQSTSAGQQSSAADKQSTSAGQQSPAADKHAEVTTNSSSTINATGRPVLQPSRQILQPKDLTANKENTIISTNARGKGPPYDYVDLSTVTEGKEYCVYGVVKFVKGPTKTRGTDWSLMFSITDQSLFDLRGEYGKIKCVLFESAESKLPAIKVGDIIRMHRLKVVKFYEELQGQKGLGFSWLVFDGDLDGPEEPKLSSSKQSTWTNADIFKLRELREFSAGVSLPQLVSVVSDVQHDPTTPPITLSNVQKSQYFRLLCQVIAVGLYKESHKEIGWMKVWDGTKLNHTTLEIPMCNLEKIYCDEELKSLAADLSVDVWIYDEYAPRVLAFKPGDLIELSNLHSMAHNTASIINKAGFMGYQTPAHPVEVELTLHGGGAKFQRGMHELKPGESVECAEALKKRLLDIEQKSKQKTCNKSIPSDSNPSILPLTTQNERTVSTNTSTSSAASTSNIRHTASTSANQVPSSGASTSSSLDTTSVSTNNNSSALTSNNINAGIVTSSATVIGEQSAESQSNTAIIADKLLVSAVPASCSQSTVALISDNSEGANKDCSKCYKFFKSKEKSDSAGIAPDKNSSTEYSRTQQNPEDSTNITKSLPSSSEIREKSSHSSHAERHSVIVPDPCDRTAAARNPTAVPHCSPAFPVPAHPSKNPDDQSQYNDAVESQISLSQCSTSSYQTAVIRSPVVSPTATRGVSLSQVSNSSYQTAVSLSPRFSPSAVSLSQGSTSSYYSAAGTVSPRVSPAAIRGVALSQESPSFYQTAVSMTQRVSPAAMHTTASSYHPARAATSPVAAHDPSKCSQNICHIVASSVEADYKSCKNNQNTVISTVTSLDNSHNITNTSSVASTAPHSSSTASLSSSSNAHRTAANNRTSSTVQTVTTGSVTADSSISKVTEPVSDSRKLSTDNASAVEESGAAAEVVEENEIAAASAAKSAAASAARCCDVRIVSVTGVKEEYSEMVMSHLSDVTEVLNDPDNDTDNDTDLFRVAAFVTDYQPKATTPSDFLHLFCPLCKLVTLVPGCSEESEDSSEKWSEPSTDDYSTWYHTAQPINCLEQSSQESNEEGFVKEYHCPRCLEQTGEAVVLEYIYAVTFRLWDGEDMLDISLWQEQAEMFFDGPARRCLTDLSLFQSIQSRLNDLVTSGEYMASIIYSFSHSQGSASQATPFSSQRSTAGPSGHASQPVSYPGTVPTSHRGHASQPISYPTIYGSVPTLHRGHSSQAAPGTLPTASEDKEDNSGELFHSSNESAERSREGKAGVGDQDGGSKAELREKDGGRGTTVVKVMELMIQLYNVRRDTGERLEPYIVNTLLLT